MVSKTQDEKEKQGLGLGGIFKGLGGFIELLGDLAEKGETLKREGEIKIGKEAKGVYGFTIRTGIGGEPSISSFGNIIKRTPKGPVVEEIREPITDVFDEKDKILMVAEMPGVEEDKILVEIKGDILTIESKNERKYKKEVLLPCQVLESTLKTKYKNGILRIEVKKKGTSTKKS